MAWWLPDSRWSTFRWWIPNQPQTAAEFFGQYAWERDWDENHVYLPETPGGAPVEYEITASRSAIYTIEVIDEDGALVETITDWTDGKMKFQVDQAATLNFTIPGDSDNIQYIIPANRIRVRDRFGFALEVFDLQSTTKRRDGDAIWFDVEMQSVIVQLGREPVIQYSVTETTPILDIISDLLALQQQSPAIELGQIDGSIAEYEILYTVNDSTILACLRDIQAILPTNMAGHFFVDGYRRLRWQTQIGHHDGTALELGGALQGIQYKIDHSQVITRLYAYGEGKDPSTRLKLTDAGEPEEYLDADTIGTYGVRPMSKIFETAREPAALLGLAQRVLEEVKAPVIEISLTPIDVAKADGVEFADAKDLYCGSVYIATDSPQDIEVQVGVLSLDIDMQDPLSAGLQLSNRNRDLSSLLESLFRSVRAPLDVDGDRYPTMGRNYSGATNEPYRAGDVRYNGNPQMHNGTVWEDMNAASGNAVIWKVSNYAGFAALTEDVDGDLGYTQDLRNFYINENGAYRVHGIFKQASAPSSIGELNGDLWYDTTNHNLMVLKNSTWRITHAHIANSTPAGTVNDGDHWYEEDADIFWIRRNGVWVSIAATHIATAAPSSGVVNGDFWYDSTLKEMFVRRNGVWRIIHAHIADSAPSTNVLDGDFWYEEDSDRLWYRRSGTWNPVHKGTTRLTFWDGTANLDITHFST